MKLPIILTALSLLCAMSIKSQKNNLTLEDLIPGGKTYRKYTPQTLDKLMWHGDKLTYHKGDSIFIQNEKGATPFITLDQINKTLTSNEKLRNLSTVSLNKEGDKLFASTANHFYVCSTTAKETRGKFRLTPEISNRDFSEEALSIAYTKENNLYIQNSQGEEKAISHEKNNKIVYGKSVHQNEFGIHKGTFWSPKGKFLAFYKMDQSMVDVYPLVDISTRMASLKEHVYPMAGLKSHHVTVGIYNTKTDQTIYLKTGLPKEKYLTNIAWNPDETTIYIAELNRSQDTCTVNCYDIATGKKLKTLFTETHPKYVEPENPILFVREDPSKFIWQSKRDGYNHLYMYNANGELLKQVTRGEFDVTEVLGFDKNGKNIFYVSTENNPLERHIYKVDLKNGKKTKLSNKEGVHSARLSASGSYIFDRYSSQNNPGELAIIDTQTSKSSVFYSSRNPFTSISMPEIQLGTLKADDGKTDLHYRIVKPTDFDENKKYPVIVYVYGGPHSQMVTNTWMGQARGWDLHMANKGYIVFTMDNRGTSNRGLEFENTTHRQLGITETKDQMKGVEYLKSLPYVDGDRIGVHGWSYGGFMTLNLMLRHPEVFKVGVAGGPVTDWKYYEIMYGERYMDSPQENSEGYKETSMLNHIGNLQGRLLLIHGDEDPVVVLQHNMQLIKSAVKEGVHPDFFVYPGHGHNMIGKDRVHLHEHITRYFDDFLK